MTMKRKSEDINQQKIYAGVKKPTIIETIILNRSR
jgi:hypothetical protein